MKLRRTAALSVVSLLCALSAWAAGADQPTPSTGPYQPIWQSLKAHQNPAWFRDAKFGIYTHWGPVTVGSENSPAGGQWYGREMYDRGSPVFQFHRRQFGDQMKVGYKDLIRQFKAEKFDAEAWADLFARSGARFAGPVAVHHDNFAMWDSRVTPWNSVRMGPHRDITGELEKAVKRHGMKFFTSFHHGFAWQYYEPAFAFDAADPRYAKLYTQAHKEGVPPSREFLDQWLAMVNEAVAKYQPDMIWFDFELMAVITPEYQQRMFADYYNWAAQHGRESAVAHKFREIHQYTGVLDFERGREDRLVPYPWLTDTALAEWFNQKCAPYRSMDNLVNVFVDIVAKNGCMLLDVSPAADGTIPAEARRMLLAMGDWLRINGEAIYGSRPWAIYGEGPTKGKGGGFSEGGDKPFTAEDIRFTTQGSSLYAIALGWPKDGKLRIKSLATAAGKVTSVNLLGHAGALAWTQSERGLEVTLPAEKPCQHAYTLKILGAGLRPASAADSPVKQAGHAPVAARDNPPDWIERTEDITKWRAVRATLERSKEHVSHGEYSAKLTVLDRKPDLSLHFADGGYASKDWSGYDKLLIDVYNPMDKVLDSTFEVSLRNSFCQEREGVDQLSIGEWNGGFPPHQWHTVSLPLLVGLSQMSDEGKFNFADVASVHLHPGGYWKGKGIVLYLDNLRLAKNQPVAEPSLHLNAELPGAVYHHKNDVRFKIKLHNESSHEETASLDVHLEDAAGKTIHSIAAANLSFAPHEEKLVEEKGDLSAVPEGRYVLVSSLSKAGKPIVRRENEIILKSSPVYVLADLSDAVCHRDEGLGLKARLRNDHPDDEQVKLSVWLESSSGKKVKAVCERAASVPKGAEEVLGERFTVADLPEGKYVLVASLSGPNNKVCDQERKPLRIIGPFVAPHQRDMNYLYFPWKYYMPWKPNPEDRAQFCQELEQIIDEMGFYSHGILFFPGYYDVAHGMDDEQLTKNFAMLRSLKVPFVVSFFHPSGLDFLQYSHETLTGKAKRMIGLAEQLGGRYFLGIDLPEPENISPYRFLTSKTGRLEKMDAYRAWIRRFGKDVGLPPQKIWLARLATGMSYGLNYDASLTLVMQEALMFLGNAELTQSRLRGAARSFGKPWGIDFARWTTEEGRKEVLPYDKRTGRYSATLQKFCIDTEWWQLDSGPAVDAYKTYIQTYYHGAQFINGQSERPLTDKGGKQAILKFLDLAEKAPRCQQIVSKIAVVEGKGSYWAAPTYYPRNWTEGQEVSFGFPYTGTLGGWVSKGLTLKEEADFDYLDIFFPESVLGDRLSSKSFWTGTPYGAVNVIYPAMKLEDLKKYDAIFFLGYHRMDSVRPDFLADLMTYVRQGGVVLVSVDQLRDSKDTLDAAKLEPFLGARIGSAKRDLKDFIEVTEPTAFQLATKKYPVAPQTCKLDRETKPWVYEVTAKGAKTFARDGRGAPVFLLNRYGQGQVFVCAAPTLSMLLAPGGKDPIRDPVSERIGLVKDIVDKVCKRKPLPLDISPKNDNVEFLISTTGTKEAAIFIMNHGPRDWSGEIIVNRRAAGLSAEVAEAIKAKIGTDYQVRETTPRVTADQSSLRISGISLSGDKDKFCSYRQASFAWIRLEKGKP